MGDVTASRLPCALLSGAAGRSSERALRALVAGDGADAKDEALRLLVADSAVDAVVAGERGDEELRREVEDVAAGLRRGSGGAFVFAAFERSLSAPALARLEPRRAIDAVLHLLRVFAGTDACALWEAGPDGETACTNAAGPLDAEAAGAVSEAVATLAPARAGGTVAVPQLRGGRVAGGLAADAAGAAGRVAAFLASAASAVEQILDREQLAEQAAAQQLAAAGQLERRLTRLAYDLHDGALQELAALGLDLDLASRQIGSIVADGDRTRVEGRIEDLRARLLGLDTTLRDVVQSLKGGPSAAEPLAWRLELEADAIRAEGIQAVVALDGDFDVLTDSQRIAVLRVVQEALANVREHSGAGTVSVQVVERGGRVEGVIEDDGRGFDAAAAADDASRRRRFGLCGMRDRVRLLGGRLRIESEPGRGTRVSFALAAWKPAVASPDRPLGIAV